MTLGSKVERDDFAGWTFQPTARAMWEMTPHQRTWAAVSQAVRAGDEGHIGRHLTLLWDDPARTSPDFEEKHRFRAPTRGE